MPCYFNGGVIPGDMVSCAATTGASWVEPETASTIGNGELDFADVGSFFRDPQQAAKDYWKGNSAGDILLDASMLVPGAGLVGAGARGISKAATSKSAANLFNKLFKKDVNRLSKGTGKIPKGQPLPVMGNKSIGMPSGKSKSMLLPKRDAAGNIIHQQTKAFSPGKIALGSSVATGVGGLLMNNQEADNVTQGAQGIPWRDKIKNLNVTEEDKQALKEEGLDPAVASSIPSLWDKMQTKGFWMDGIEGGGGAWDNKLYRLGEMMNYMGMPSDKRGDAPSKRWQGAALKNREIGGDKLKAAMLSQQKDQKAVADFYNKGRTKFKTADVEENIQAVADNMIGYFDWGIDADEIGPLISARVVQRLNREEGDPTTIIQEEIRKLKKEKVWF